MPKGFKGSRRTAVRAGHRAQTARPSRSFRHCCFFGLQLPCALCEHHALRVQRLEHGPFKNLAGFGETCWGRQESLGKSLIKAAHGSGYPDGLRGDDIPLLAQIMGMVDVFDAMTTTRPYKPAVSRDRACEELAGEAARGWRRADLVEAFVDLVRGERLPRVEQPLRVSRAPR